MQAIEYSAMFFVKISVVFFERTKINEGSLAFKRGHAVTDAFGGLGDLGFD